MEGDLTERKRKKKFKKHSSKTKKMKRDKSVPDDDVSSASEGELQWVESTGAGELHVPKRDSWMTVPLSPSSGSLTELAHRKAIEEDRNDGLKVSRYPQLL